LSSTEHRLAQFVQRRLSTFYGLESGPDVAEFVRLTEPPGRERVLVRQSAEAVELLVELPRCRLADAMDQRRLSDTYLQLIEGVSHFVHLVERIRVDLPTTQLELELQAEVDKLVSMALGTPQSNWSRLRRVHRDLYGGGTYLHARNTEAGDRYRFANKLAARMTARLLGEPDRMQGALRSFYRASLQDKIHLARAA
jgi:hypothetical protein